MIQSEKERGKLALATPRVGRKKFVGVSFCEEGVRHTATNVSHGSTMKGYLS
jgi:hypothetical protein